MKKLIIYFNFLLLLTMSGISNTYATEVQYFTDYSLAGGGFSTNSYYSELLAKGGVFLTDKFQIGGGLGLIYYNTNVYATENYSESDNLYNIQDGSFEVFLTTQYNISTRWFVFAQGGLSPIQGSDSYYSSTVVDLSQSPNNCDTSSTPSNTKPCEDYYKENSNLDLKNLGFAELGFGFLFTQGAYLAVSYKVFSQNITTHSSSSTPYFDSNNDCATAPICYDIENSSSTRSKLNHTISFKIGIYIDDIYSGLDYYK